MIVAIAQVVPRDCARIEGAVASVHPHGSAPTFLDIVLCDGTGEITLLFQGRTEIPGVLPGARLRVVGVPLQMSDVLLMLNPTYEFID